MSFVTRGGSVSLVILVTSNASADGGAFLDADAGPGLFLVPARVAVTLPSQEITYTVSAPVSADTGQSSLYFHGVLGNTQHDLILPISIRGQPGTLDLTFGTQGVVRTNFGGEEGVTAALVDDSGRLLLAGTNVFFNGSTTLYRSVVARYLSDGRSDPTFGAAGKVGPFGSHGADAIGAFATGEILIVGAPPAIGASRLTATGSLDSAFGSGGTIDAGFYTRTTTVLSDGRFLIAGHAGCAGGNCPHHFAVSRWNYNGTRDSSFADGGLAIIPLLSGYGYVTQGFARPDQSFLLVGQGDDYTTGSSGLGLAAVLDNGDAFPGFDGGIRYLPTGNLMIKSSAAMSDGRFVVLGETGTGGGSAQDIVLLRLKPSGDLDPSFGNFGVVRTDLSVSIDAPTALALDSAGRPIVVGISYPGGGGLGVPFVCRYQVSGQLDPAFGGSGTVYPSPFAPGTTSFGAVAVDRAGFIVAAGTTSSDFVALRIWP